MVTSCCGVAETSSLHQNQSLHDMRLLQNGTGSRGGVEPETTFKFVSDFVAFVFNVAVYAGLSGCVSLVGIVANIVNILVFVRQGVFKESSNVSLLGLAIADLCSVTTMLWMSVGFSIVLSDPPGLSWVPYDVAYVTAIWPHIVSAQMTRMITAYVAFERCMCVVFPFKVRRLFTPRRSLIVVVSIFCYCLVSYSPVFVVHQLRHKTHPDTNRTRLSLHVTQHRQLVVDVVSYVNSIVFNIGSVAVVLFCTTITVSKVKLSKAWRESVTTANNSSNEKLENAARAGGGLKSPTNPAAPPDPGDNVKLTKGAMQKEMKLVRMITLISVIFLVCYCPDLTFLIMISVDQEINVAGRYTNLAHLMYSLTFFMESINSSINILVYYNMSSKYQQELKRLVGKSADPEKGSKKS